MINLFKLQIKKIYIEEKYKRENVPLIKYRWWATLKAIDKLMKEMKNENR